MLLETIVGIISPGSLPGRSDNRAERASMAQEDQGKAAATMAVMGNVGAIFGTYLYSFYLSKMYIVPMSTYLIKTPIYIVRFNFHRFMYYIFTPRKLYYILIFFHLVVLF